VTNGSNVNYCPLHRAGLVDGLVLIIGKRWSERHFLEPVIIKLALLDKIFGSEHIPDRFFCGGKYEKVRG